jgi:hypothetical protein
MEDIMPKTTKSEKIPENMQELFDKIIKLTDDCSKKYLNDDYSQFSGYFTAALCRKRPSPLLKGRPNTWACGIIYALGFVNFLFDKKTSPYVSANDLCKHFGISTSTAYAKSKTIRDTFGMYQLDPDWCLPCLMDDNPLAWMVKVNGFISSSTAKGYLRVC